MTSALIVPAAGSGARLGLSVPKALADVCGLPLVCRTLQRFVSVDGLGQVVVAAPTGAVADFTVAIDALDMRGCALRIVAGGATRQESVRLALAELDGAPDVVMVHDAARPLVSREAIEAVLAAGAVGAATLASVPADSVREVGHDARSGSRPIERAGLRMVGTPQAFRTRLLVQAHERGRAEGLEATDDASLVEKYTGARIELIVRDEPNLKVTRPDDLDLVRLIVADRLLRERSR